MSNDLFRPVRWEGDAETGYLWMLDQRKLPAEEVAIDLHRYGAVAEAITDMVVRGAPAIGVSAAYGVVLAAREAAAIPPTQADAYFRSALKLLAKARPTAINLGWAIERMLKVYVEVMDGPPSLIVSTLFNEANEIQAEDTAANLAMAKHGAALFDGPVNILTHCNTGALATSAVGTALGVIRELHNQGKLKMCYACETRPYLQGARLTAWELQREGIPVTLITDSMAGHLMKTGEIDGVILGSDRIAANGDVANKIGTYSHAVLAKHHGLPFYVAAPNSTIDPNTVHGDDIPIEERGADEVTTVSGMRIAPEGIKVRHPAFDVTPAELVTAIVTETGVASPPSAATVAELLDN
ncbi:MAG: S-methyl-5-thioribose-1-phosphate isomerase [Myxococcales bacterium]|nr:S-methyl-5-thioribose-1-phosphate isomerase [Myxococcales bacterium]